MVGPSERDIVVDVTIREDTKGADRAAKSLGDVDKAAGKAGKSLHGMGNESHLLDTEIAKTTTRIRELEAQMVRTSDRTMRRQISSERSWLRELERIGSASRRAGWDIAGDFSQIASEGRGFLIAGAVSGAMVLAPLVGSLIAGAVIGGVGIGGIIGGVVAASHDAKVREAFKGLGSRMSTDIKIDAASFVEPLVASADIFGQNWARISPQLATIFQTLSRGVEPLARGFGGFVEELMPGFVAASRTALGIMRDLEHELPELGRAVSDFFEVLATEDSRQGFSNLLHGLEGTIRLTGAAIAGLSQTFNDLDKVPKWAWVIPGAGALGVAYGAVGTMTHGVDSLNDAMANNNKESGSMLVGVHALKSAYAPMTTAVYDLGAAIAEANAQLIIFNDEISGMIDDQLRLDEANLAVEQGFADLTEKILENGGALNDGTQAGRDNEQFILDQIKILSAQRDAYIKVTGKTDEATAAYDEQIKRLIEIGVKGGIARQAMEDLAGNYTVTVAFMADMSRWLNVYGSQIPGYGFDVTSFASGGTTPSSEVFRVGESGPEYLFSSRQHYVATKQQMDSMSGWGGGGSTVTVVLDVRGGDEKFKQWVRNWARIEGNGNIQTAVSGS